MEKACHDYAMKIEGGVKKNLLHVKTCLHPPEQGWLWHQKGLTSASQTSIIASEEWKRQSGNCSKT